MAAATQKARRPKIDPVDLAVALGQHPPTPEQAAVIAAPLGPTLVVAGAGAGKTETMAARVVWLVANGYARPSEVLGLTFTRKASGQLLRRVRTRLARLAGAGLIPGGQGEAGDAPGSALAAGRRARIAVMPFADLDSPREASGAPGANPPPAHPIARALATVGSALGYDVLELSVKGAPEATLAQLMPRLAGHSTIRTAVMGEAASVGALAALAQPVRRRDRPQRSAV